MRTIFNLRLSTFQMCLVNLQFVTVIQTQKISPFFQKHDFCEQHISETIRDRNLKQKPKDAHIHQVNESKNRKKLAYVNERKNPFKRT